MRHFWSAASNLVSGPAPLLLARMFAQVVSTSPPKGVTRPRPVTTTRRIFALQSHQRPCRVRLSLRFPAPSGGPFAAGSGQSAWLSALVFFDVLVGIADGRDLLGRIVGNLDADLFLERHHQFDDVETVGAQIVDEAGVGGHLVGFDAEVLDNDLLHAFGGVAHEKSSQRKRFETRPKPLINAAPAGKCVGCGRRIPTTGPPPGSHPVQTRRCRTARRAWEIYIFPAAGAHPS